MTSTSFAAIQRDALRSRPLVVWRAPQLEAMSSALRVRCREWAQDWGLELDGESRCERTSGPGLVPWQPLVREHGVGCWVWLPPDLPKWIARGLLGVESPSSPLALAILESCLADLRRQLAEIGSWHPCGTEAAVAGMPARFPRWREGLLAMLPMGMRMLFDAQAAQGLLQALRALPDRRGPRPREPGVVSLSAAMADASLRVQVKLEGCELELGRLRELQVGDVLRLGHQVEAPASVQSATGEALFSGFLVRSRGRKAVELAPAS